VQDESIEGVGSVVVPLTGEDLGQYGFDLTLRPLRVGLLQTTLHIDLPLALAVRCRAAGLPLELRLDDGRHLTFLITDVGPGGADVEPLTGFMAPAPQGGPA
jgi:hypothetical protein